MVKAMDDETGDEPVRRIYYSGFWYTRGLFAKPDTLTSTAVKIRIEEVLTELRLLALVFDQIYVPRSHLLTSFHVAHRDCLSGVIASQEFEWLSNSKILVSSVMPSHDAISDTERIDHRLRRLKWLRPALFKNDRKSVQDVSSVDIDSNKEASSSISDYLKMAKKIALARGADGLSDLIGASQYREVEFFHERFLNLLWGGDWSSDVKQELWRATNEVYLANVGSELGDIVVPYDGQIEPLIARRDKNSDLDSRLFSTVALRAVLNTVADSKSVALWLGQRMDRAFGYRLDTRSEEWKSWKSFQAAYFELMSVVNDVLLYMRKSHGAELPDVRPVVEAEMTRISDKWGGDAVAAVVQAAGGLAQLGDPTAGVVTRAGAAGATGLFNRVIKWLIVTWRYKPIVSFVKRSVVGRGNA